MALPRLRRLFCRQTLFLLFTLTMSGSAVAEAVSISDGKASIRARDYTKAASIFTQLAQQGDHEAEYQLARLYRSGKGVTKDNKLAFKWLMAAAQKKAYQCTIQLGHTL